MGWRRRPLQAAGHQVAAPSLMGVGDQSAEDVSLTAHIDKIVQLVQHDQADPVILVGFSYGGFVVAGAADRLGAQVSRLIYLEALLPTSGRSFLDLLPEAARAAMQQAADAFGGWKRIPRLRLRWSRNRRPGTRRSAGACRRRASPARISTDGQLYRPLPGRPDAALLPAMFISCTDKPDGDPLLAVADRVQAQGWTVHQLATGQFAMVTMPRALTRSYLFGAHSQQRRRTRSGDLRNPRARCTRSPGW